MNTADTVDAEFTERGTALATRPNGAVAAPPSSLFNTDDPEKFVEWTTKVANALVRVIEQKGLAKSLNRQKPQDKFVELEGWQLLGGMTKVYAVVEWTKELENGWEARAQAFTLDGALVGAGEAVCLRSESNWKSRDSYAIKGMAQTRAMSRALRAPLGFIMTLAGYRATAAEEIPEDPPVAAQREQPARAVAERPLDVPGSLQERTASELAKKLGALSVDTAFTPTEEAKLWSTATHGRLTDPMNLDLKLLSENEGRRLYKLIAARADALPKQPPAPAPTEEELPL